MEYPLHLTLKSGRINDIATRWIKDSLEELQDSHFRIKSSKTENDFVGGGPPSFLIMTSFRLLRRVTGASHAAGVKFNSRGQVPTLSGRRPGSEPTLTDPVRVAFTSTDIVRRNQSHTRPETVVTLP